MEPEEQISFNIKPRRITNARRRSSLFDEQSISLTEKIAPSMNEYIDLLNKESEDWTKLMEQKALELRLKKKSQVNIIDTNVLNNEQIVYIENAPNFQELVDESKKFCEKAEFFLLSYADLIERKNDIIDRTEAMINTKAMKAICRETNKY